LRWRKRDSDLPFWKRKILESPRTKILPYNTKKAILAKVELAIFQFLVRSGEKAIVRNHSER
jgi:hypothetical protein